MNKFRKNIKEKHQSFPDKLKRKNTLTIKKEKKQQK